MTVPTTAQLAVVPAAPGTRREDVPAGKQDTNRKRLARLGWAFSTPAFLVVAAFTIFPIAFSIMMSVSHVTVSGNGFSLRGITGSNYNVLAHAAQWKYALAFTVVYTIITVAIEVIIGTGIALVLERLTKGRGLMMALLLIPWSMITVISAELWGYIYDASYGVLDQVFGALGLGHPVILGTSTPAIAAMMAADVWKTTPFVAIIVLAGLVMLPEELYEAAEMDGCSGWKVFWRITFPLLRPTIALAVLFRILQAFGLFDLPFVLTQGGPGYSTTSLAVLGYNTMFQDLDFGPGAAVATSTAVLVLIGCLAFLRVFKAQVGEEGS